MNFFPDGCGVIEFDGPSVGRVFGQPYVTLTSSGIKHEGASCETFPSALEAWAKYTAELHKLAKGAKQVAWRLRPELRETQDGYAVYSRLCIFED